MLNTYKVWSPEVEDEESAVAYTASTMNMAIHNWADNDNPDGKAWESSKVLAKRLPDGEVQTYKVYAQVEVNFEVVSEAKKVMKEPCCRCGSELNHKPGCMYADIDIPICCGCCRKDPYALMPPLPDDKRPCDDYRRSN